MMMMGERSGKLLWQGNSTSRANGDNPMLENQALSHAAPSATSWAAGPLASPVRPAQLH